MGWWGKVIGGTFGFMLGGPLGAILGAAFGHQFDKGLGGMPQGETIDAGGQERIQTAFFTATFSVMGHIAKVDGQVSPDEIELAEAVMRQMDLNPEMRETAIRLFNQGKAPDFPLDEVLSQFRSECRRRINLLRMFLEIQVQAAYADGRLHAAEERVLRQICRRLGFPEFVLREIERMIRAESHFRAGAGGRRAAEPQRPSLDDAYAMLGVEAAASDEEVKKAYRRLINRHHPDKLVAKGLPEEMMKLATQKTHEIRQAYERVKEARGL